MSNRTPPIVPRRRRDEAPPPAPLDPYVTQLIQWIASRDHRINPNSLAKQAASALDWPQPFADVIVTAARARRLLTLVQVSERGGYRVGLSSRGRAWLDRAGASQTPGDQAESNVGAAMESEAADPALVEEWSSVE